MRYPIMFNVSLIARKGQRLVALPLLIPKRKQASRFLAYVAVLPYRTHCAVGLLVIYNREKETLSLYARSVYNAGDITRAPGREGRDRSGGAGGARTRSELSAEPCAASGGIRGVGS